MSIVDRYGQVYSVCNVHRCTVVDGDCEHCEEDRKEELVADLAQDVYQTVIRVTREDMVTCWYLARKVAEELEQTWAFQPR